MLGDMVNDLLGVRFDSYPLELFEKEVDFELRNRSSLSRQDAIESVATRLARDGVKTLEGYERQLNGSLNSRRLPPTTR